MYCKTCKWWDFDPTEESKNFDVLGFCLRFPPILLVPKKGRTLSELAELSTRPVLPGMSSCGEHTPV